MQALRAMAAAAALASMAAGASAAELKVLTAGAFKPVVTALAPLFEQRSGHRLVVDNDTAGALVRRIGDGEAFDVVVLTPAALDQLAKSGRIGAGAPQRLAGPVGGSARGRPNLTST